ncbi:retrovirus-related pol polyprotein from transposon TNT 1-94 [Tanacetum coccineum]
MKNNFEMSMMGELKFFLRLQVHQSPRGIFISQSQYAIELLKKHGLDECVSMSTPMETERLDVDLQSTPTEQTTYRRMIGGLMYLIASRPDIAFATFVCARYQARPMVKHLNKVKQIFRYLRQSYNMGLWYPKDSGFELIAYSDADHAGCKDDCKSTSGGLQFLGGKLVSWSSKKQDCTAMSTAEAEYVSLSACCAQVIWMRTQLLDYGYKYNRIPMYCDSKSAIAISCNPVQHSKTKHIDIRYHFIKEHVEKGTVEIYFVGTEYQLADLFTKALPKERFEYLVHRIDTQGQIKVLPPRTAEEIVARERERKARTTLLMALPEDHLAKFHKMTDAKEMWDAIKSRFGGNDEDAEVYLEATLEIHGAGVSTEDANQKFLRSLPSAWSQVSLIMRTKPGVDSLSFDDLYNNLRVFESDIKGSTASSSSPQNVAFVSENTSSTNDVRDSKSSESVRDS